mgnify:CR=1 FL=1
MKKILGLLFVLLSLSASSCDGDNGPTPPPISPELIQGPPIGLGALPCLTGPAWDGPQGNCKILTEILIESRVANPAMNFIIGGGFGIDPGRLNHIVQKLGVGGRRPHILLYVTNGASQRQFDTTPVQGLGTQISPEDWRWHVMNNPSVIETYKNLIRTYSQSYESLKALGGEIIFCPAQEDNLTNGAFQKLK